MQPDNMRLLPRDLDAERAVLASLLLRGGMPPEIGELLEPADFHDDRHRAIYAALVSIAREAVPLDLVTLRRRLEERDQLERCGGPAGLAALLDGAVRSANVTAYARRVHERARARRVVANANALMIEAGNGANSTVMREILEVLRSEVEAAADALAAEDLAEILARPAPETPWAVEDLLAEQDVALLSGQGGLKKTWLAYSIVLSLATGKPVFGRFEVARPYRLALLDLESRPWEVDGRLHRLARGMDLTPEAVTERVSVIRCRLRLDRPEDLRRLMASLKARGTEFLLVDSMRRAFGGDENDSRAVSDLFVTGLDRIRSELGCGVLLTDHTRKLTGERELDAADQALRGSTDKRNMADAHFGVEPREERLAFVPTKTRHAALPEAVLLEVAGLEADAGPDGPVVVRCLGTVDRASDKVQDRIIALLEQAGPGGLLRGEIIGRAGYSVRAVSEALSALRRRDRITRRSEGKQARYVHTEASGVQRVQTCAPLMEVP